MRKICSKCGIEKELTEYFKRKDTKDGHRADCKQCKSKENKKWNSNNAEKLNIIKKVYYQENSDKIKSNISKQRKENTKKRKEDIENEKLCIEKYRLDNPKEEKARIEKLKEEKKEKVNAYRLKNAEKINALRREHYKENREKILLRNNKYAGENKEKINKQERNRRKADINYKITRNLRSRLYGTIKKGHKSASTMQLLGCTIEHLMTHLESKFTQGMTFDNYGEWHIDHIRPCASFDLTDTKQQEVCFNYTNLQPLWADDNLSKGDKYNNK